MSDKLRCEIVQDLLPSYVDGLTSDETNEAIKDHLADCVSCRDMYERMKADETSAEENSEVMEKEKKEILEEVCELFELSEFWYKKCEKCSVGMQQRIALAMAFAGKPQWIILDEPFNGLDPSSVKMALNAIRKVAKKGTAVIISSHLLYDIEKICDRALVLSKGTLLANKEVAEIVEKYNSIENFYFEIIEG